MSRRKPCPWCNVKHPSYQVCDKEHDLAPAEFDLMSTPFVSYCQNGCVRVDGAWEPVLGCPTHLNPHLKDIGPSFPKEEIVKDKRDNVAHYTVGEIECIDYIFDKLGYEGGMAYILGNQIKYSSRANHKGQRRSDMTKIVNYGKIALEKMDQNGELE